MLVARPHQDSAGTTARSSRRKRSTTGPTSTASPSAGRRSRSTTRSSKPSTVRYAVSAYRYIGSRPRRIFDGRSRRGAMTTTTDVRIAVWRTFRRSSFGPAPAVPRAAASSIFHRPSGLNSGRTANRRGLTLIVDQETRSPQGLRPSLRSQPRSGWAGCQRAYDIKFACSQGGSQPRPTSSRRFDAESMGALASRHQVAPSLPTPPYAPYVGSR